MDKDNRGKNQKKPNAEPLLLTVGEVARLLRLSTSMVYTLLGDRCPGGIPVMRIGRSVRISLDDLRWWVAHYPKASKPAGNARKVDSQG